MSDSPVPRPGNQDQSRDLINYIGELELLVSGAALFAMLKLPGWLQAHLMPLADRFSDNLGAMIFVLGTYLSAGAAILALTFALHLALRARWIALVGIRMAFPGGVRWKRMKASANVRAVIRRNDPGAEGVIQRAATQATIVFASGLVLASIVLTSAIAAILAIVVGYLSELVKHPIDPMIVFIGIAVLVFLPLLVVAMIDQLLARRLPVKGKLQRGLAHILGFYARVGLLPGFSLSRLLQSQGGEIRTTVIGTSVVVFAMLLVAGSIFMQAAPMHFGSYNQFPHFESESRSEHVLSSAQYADQRDAHEGSRVAYIQSRVVSDDYLQLTVPYEPTEDGLAITRQCPEVAGAEEEKDARALATLDCLTRLHPVTLDGEPLADLRYQVGVAPDTRRPVLLAMIDVRGLALGRHELRVTATPDDDDSDDAEPEGPWVIPFWR